MECVAKSDREKVKKALRLFHLFRKRPASYDGFSVKRGDARAYGILKRNNGFVNTGNHVGAVPGIKVGDRFQYRLEMCVVGLHCQTVHGIDYYGKRGRDMIATSVVSSGACGDSISTVGDIIYTGEGGRPDKEHPSGKDQELIDGNLALVKSRIAGNPVRFIHGIRVAKSNKQADVFIYYGLYKVVKHWTEISSYQHLVYKFKLRRIPNQPAIVI